MRAHSQLTQRLSSKSLLAACTNTNSKTIHVIIVDRWKKTIVDENGEEESLELAANIGLDGQRNLVDPNRYTINHKWQKGHSLNFTHTITGTVYSQLVTQ
jgi:hypothetical protein